MPVYTHFQPAMPIGYGYYLAGIATALDRDIVALRHAVEQLARCPLGAGAVAGTDLPIAPAAHRGAARASPTPPRTPPTRWPPGTPCCGPSRRSPRPG